MNQCCISEQQEVNLQQRHGKFVFVPFSSSFILMSLPCSPPPSGSRLPLGDLIG